MQNSIWISYLWLELYFCGSQSWHDGFAFGAVICGRIATLFPSGNPDGLLWGARWAESSNPSTNSCSKLKSAKVSRGVTFVLHNRGKGNVNLEQLFMDGWQLCPRQGILMGCRGEVRWTESPHPSTNSCSKLIFHYSR